MIFLAGRGDVNRNGVLGLCLTLLLCGNTFLLRFLRRQTFFLCLLFGCDTFFFGFLLSGNAFLLCFFLINDLEGQFVALRRAFFGNQCKGAFLCLRMQDNARPLSAPPLQACHRTAQARGWRHPHPWACM